MNSNPTNILIVHEIIQSFSLWLCNQSTSQWNHTNISNKHKDKKSSSNNNTNCGNQFSVDELNETPFSFDMKADKFYFGCYFG